MIYLPTVTFCRMINITNQARGSFCHDIDFQRHENLFPTEKDLTQHCNRSHQQDGLKHFCPHESALQENSSAEETSSATMTEFMGRRSKSVPTSIVYVIESHFQITPLLPVTYKKFMVLLILVSLRRTYT
jgi:hypothetical protein